jgi:glycosyltransferase involved in cell wall biosynthesis
MSQDMDVSPQVTVVLPIYRNQRTVEPLFERLCDMLEGASLSFEVIFVDDACPEDSLAVLRSLAREDRRVAVVALAENTGQQRAIFTGLRYARGERVVVMDADLQDPPEAIPRLLSALDEGFDAVFAGRIGQYESLSRLATAWFYRALLGLLTGLPAGAGSFVVMSDRMVRRILALTVPSPYLTSMIGCSGLPVKMIPVQRASRTIGESAYSARMRWAAASAALRCALHCKWPSGRDSWQPGPVKALIGARFEEPG